MCSIHITTEDNAFALRPKFLNVLEQIKEKAERQIQAVSQGLNESSARKAFKAAINATRYVLAGDGAKSLSNAGVGVALSSSTACQYVDITANGGQIAVGVDTSVQMTTPHGVVLTPGTAPYRIQTLNLANVYVSGATGSSACFVYYA